MPTPDYIATIRRVYGPGRLLLPGVSTVVVRTDLEPGQIHLLLTKRSDTGRWSLPSGIVEPSEQPAAAALREKSHGSPRTSYRRILVTSRYAVSTARWRIEMTASSTFNSHCARAQDSRTPGVTKGGFVIMKGS